MNLSIVLCISFCSCVVIISEAFAKPGKKPGRKWKRPNIVYILGDDIGFNDVGWKNPRIKTPYMNQLAAEGVILDQYYAMPQCTPSRAALMTGLYAQEVGLQRGVLQPQEAYGVPLAFEMLPRILKRKAKYATHMLGKWNLGFCDIAYTPTRRGFDTFLGFYNGAEENYYHCLSPFSIYDPISNCTGFDFRDQFEVATQFNGQYSTYIHNDRAVKIIKEHNKEDPLFLYVALTATHFPTEGDKFVDLCNDSPPNRVQFCGAMAGVDEAVKNITEALIEAGLYENTVLVFASDNGGTTSFGGNNYPLRGGKETLWEGGNRVPAFIHSPLLKKRGYINSGVFHIVDWYATFLELAGIKKCKTIDGVSQWKSVSLNKSSPRTEFPYSIDIVNGTYLAAVRVGDWKLIAGAAGNEDGWITENETRDESFNPVFLQEYILTPLPFNLSDRTPKLFNLADDPYEKNDLADSMPDKVKELWPRLQYYIDIAEPAVKLKADPAGDPANFNNTYSFGWCTADIFVPPAKQYSDHNIGIDL